MAAARMLTAQAAAHHWAKRGRDAIERAALSCGWGRNAPIFGRFRAGEMPEKRI